MKRFFVIFLIVFTAFKVLGQQSVDVGFFAGAGTYFGDMTKTEWSKSVNPAYGAFLRFNFNPRYALRFNVVNGTIGAEGQFVDVPTQFKKNVLDISFQFEFNFFKYIVGQKETPYSTYIFGGAGMQTYQFNIDNIGGSEISPTIPFGLGFKVNLSKHFGLGFETGLRKTFSDKLDNLDDPLSYKITNGDKVTQIKYTDSYHNNDWTSYTGVHLVYKLIYGSKEWQIKSPKKKILDWGIDNN